MNTTARPVRAVLIDLDGTLVDTLPEIAAAINATLHDAGLPPIEAARVAEAIGEGSITLVERLVGPGLSSRWLPVYLEHYRAYNGRMAQLYPNVREGLARMRADGLSIACVTNKPRELMQPLFETLGIADALDVLVGAGDTVERKPHPAPLLAACERLGMEPAVTVMIGDSENDALAGRAASITSLTVPYGYPGIAGPEGRPEALLERGITCAIVPDLLAAATWIAERNASAVGSESARGR